MAVLTLRLNGDGTLELSKSTGTQAYILLDESVLDEADYVYISGSSTATQTDNYALANHSTESDTINSVTLKAYSKEVATGSDATHASIKFGVRMEATNYLGSAQNLTTTTALYSATWATNPNTGSAWTWTNIDALIPILQLYMHASDKSNYNVPRCFMFWVEVTYGETGGGVVMPIFTYYYEG